MKLLTKARTLEQLSDVITTAEVLPFHIFTAKTFQDNPEAVIGSIQQKFKAKSLIVRSSSKEEDCIDASNAGKYLSLTNVPSESAEKLVVAIKGVISSYGTEQNLNLCEVLVQPMLTDIKIAGVALTADLDNLAAYYIINYDESGDPDGITSGVQKSSKTYIQYKHSPFSSAPDILCTLIKTLQELEVLYPDVFLDIEFAIDSKGQVYLFQIRPIVTSGKEDLSRVDLRDSLSKIFKKVEKLSKPSHNLLGDYSVFGVMPDWNPAEIIGIKPKRLAYSLYKEIITDGIWAYQRDNYGYRNMRSYPLMVMYMGVPYIDVRVDFNSFIPKSVSDSTAVKLVNFYLKKLKTHPKFHDKVEFEIVYSSFHFGLEDKLQELFSEGFTVKEIDEIKKALLKVTNMIIDPKFGHYKADVEKIEILNQKYEAVINSGQSLVDKIYWLIEDCKRYGTLPFAGIARSAFIATQFLNSFVEQRVINTEQRAQFTRALNTVVKSLNNDLVRVYDKKISRKEFLAKYGHLRPKTYDIQSATYNENFDNYFLIDKTKKHESSSFSFNDDQLKRIQDMIDENGITISADTLIQFIRESIEMREYAKFVFTKSLSMTLTLIGEFGKRCDIDEEGMANVDIKTLLGLYSALDSRNVRDILNAEIATNKEVFQSTKAIKLPSLITKPEDIYSYHLPDEYPNFVTVKNIIAPIVSESDIDTLNITNKIVFISAADPGYDYLFTMSIAGLVTQFGGANSHMAVRCAELGIPSVIGAGEKYFSAWIKAHVLKIDCLNQQVQIIS